MTVKRDSRGTLRDYARESKRELFPVFLRLFQCCEVFDMAFPATSFFEPYGDFPWLSSAVRVFFHKAYPTHPARAITATKVFGVAAIFFWCNETKILSSIIEPISIDVVNEGPAIFRLSYDVVMDEIVTESSIAVVAFVQLNTHKFFFVNVSVHNRVSYKVMPYIIQGNFNSVSIKNSIVEDPFFIDWRQSRLAPAFLSIIMKPTKALGKVWSVAPLNSTFHAYIISKNNKISRRTNG